MQQKYLSNLLIAAFSIQHKENMHGSSLDYDKIKRDLQDGNERTKGLLLQALRWVNFDLYKVVFSNC